MEYGNTVWAPAKNEVGKIKQIEKVQQRATKLVPGIADLPCDVRMKSLTLPSLEYRRRRGDMIETWKRFNGYYDDEYKWLIRDDNVKNLKYHNRKLFKKRLEKGNISNSFGVRVVDDWNKLPAAVVNAPTMDCFKNRLDRHWGHLLFNHRD